MNILFLTRHYYPHIGGVEKHVAEIGKRLKVNGERVTVITGKVDDGLRERKTVKGIRVFRIKYPKVKFLGLAFIWMWMVKNRTLIEQSDVVHCHDVFVWYLPMKFLYPRKKVYTTFHGWEGKYPVLLKNKLMRKLSNWLSAGTINVGSYIEKYYGTKSNLITYGAVDLPKKTVKKEDLAVFVGRLEPDTGLPGLLGGLSAGKSKSKIEFVGDGSLRGACEKYGRVHGFTDPTPFLAKARVCFASGYLTALEAMSHKCVAKVSWDNPLKRDYWQMTPFYKFIKDEDTERAFKWVKTQSWDDLVERYLKLWSVSPA